MVRPPPALAPVAAPPQAGGLKRSPGAWRIRSCLCGWRCACEGLCVSTRALALMLWLTRQNTAIIRLFKELYRRQDQNHSPFILLIIGYGKSFLYVLPTMSFSSSQFARWHLPVPHWNRVFSFRGSHSQSLSSHFPPSAMCFFFSQVEGRWRTGSSRSRSAQPGLSQPTCAHGTCLTMVVLTGTWFVDFLLWCCRSVAEKNWL